MLKFYSLFIIISLLFYYLTYSVTDAVIVGLLAYGFLSLAHKRIFQLGVALGLAIAIKSLYIIPLIFLLKYKPLSYKKLFLGGLLVLSLTYIPFLLADNYAFIYSTLLYHLSQDYTLYIQKSAITLAAFINRQWGVFPPAFIFPILNLILISILWFMIKSTVDIARTLVLISFVFIISLFFSHQGLGGYYFVGSSFILFALAFNNQTK